ncbi:MAG: 3-phosphoshikimate 1-carboxyvinyltransferase [Proteobacteria bacterium]|nr:3-phosphoshikimate 1-carboxyvinyltransferase [Alphaproteobacteria bacterium]NCC03864.1 3-phosphoshikimate 1-carboxyvinyltransferase [Pseudomonadota bacterium]
MNTLNLQKKPLSSSVSDPLKGAVTPPGDKSISHRSIMLGGIAQGRTTVRGLLEGEDVFSTMAALRAMGASIERQDDAWIIDGVGLLDNLAEPSCVLDMGNSGTSARLLMGLVAGRPMTTFFTGDASLCKRPMRRVIDPLSQMGARFVSRKEGRMPLAVEGAASIRPISYRLPVASAQVKSAILLAGLSCDGITEVIEPVPTRDPTERMLRAFGAQLDISKTDDGADLIRLQGRPVLTGRTIEVPADISSAAFPMVAACLCEGSDVVLNNVGINERRAGILHSLLEMGAKIEIMNKRELGGEPVADLRVCASPLSGVTIPEARVPSMVDEYPVLAMAAALAKGTSRFCGLKELRVKESDRLTLVAKGLAQAGVAVEVEGDDLIIHGTGTPPQGGVMIDTALDHRIAMSFLVLGFVTREPMTIDDGRVIATSFPDFIPLMNRLGASLS